MVDYPTEFSSNSLELVPTLPSAAKGRFRRNLAATVQWNHRLAVKQLTNNVVEAIVLEGTYVGEEVSKKFRIYRERRLTTLPFDFKHDFDSTRSARFRDDNQRGTRGDSRWKFAE